MQSRLSARGYNMDNQHRNMTLQFKYSIRKCWLLRYFNCTRSCTDSTVSWTRVEFALPHPSFPSLLPVSSIYLNQYSSPLSIMQLLLPGLHSLGFALKKRPVLALITPCYHAAVGFKLRRQLRFINTVGGGLHTKQVTSLRQKRCDWAVMSLCAALTLEDSNVSIQRWRSRGLALSEFSGILHQSWRGFKQYSYTVSFSKYALTRDWLHLQL